MANADRLKWWTPCFRDCFVLLQGTQRTYDLSRGEKALQQWTTGEHDVIEFKVIRKAQGGHRPEGVLMLFPRGVRHTLKKLMVPQDKALEGRGMAVWLQRGLWDVCFVTLYCPLGNREVENLRKTEKLWNWVAQVKAKLPPRTLFIIGTDANGHVGSVRERTIEARTGKCSVRNKRSTCI